MFLQIKDKHMPRKPVKDLASSKAISLKTMDVKNF